MKSTFSIALLALFCLGLNSCKKDSSTSTGSGTFTATINDSIVVFDLYGTPTLVRSTPSNQKRFDVTGVSKNKLYRFTITVGEETAVGNNVSTGDHTVQLFNDDDPNTPQDESANSDAFYTISTNLNNGGGYLTDVYTENGNINISANTVSGSTGTISGTFNATLNSMGGGTNYTITNGSFTNLQYTVLN